MAMDRPGALPAPGPALTGAAPARWERGRPGYGWWWSGSDDRKRGGSGKGRTRRWASTGWPASRSRYW